MRLASWSALVGSNRGAAAGMGALRVCRAKQSFGMTEIGMLCKPKNVSAFTGLQTRTDAAYNANRDLSPGEHCGDAKRPLANNYTAVESSSCLC